MNIGNLWRWLMGQPDTSPLALTALATDLATERQAVTKPTAMPSRTGFRTPYRAQAVAADLTPARIAGLVRQARAGRPGELARLVKEIEGTDLHIMAELSKRKRAVSTLRWHLEPASTKQRDRRVAERAEQRIRRIPRLQRALLNLLDAISKGYAVVEADWVIDDSGAYPKRLDYRPQWWFAPDQEAPERWRVLDTSSPIQGIEPPRGRLIIHESQAVSGWGWEGGLGTGITWYYLFKRFALGDWVNYAELFGAPLRVGKFTPGTKPEDIERLEEVLENLGVDAWAAVPDDMKIEFVRVEGGAVGPDVYERLVKLCDRQITIGILGQTLTTTEGSSGTKAAASVHNEVRWDLTVSDAGELADTLTEQLVAPLVVFNEGEGTEVPQWRFHIEEPTDQKLIAEVRTIRVGQFKAAKELGVSVSVAQVRAELNLVEPTSGEPVIGALTRRFTPARPRRCPACGGGNALASGQLPPHLAQLDALVDQFRAGVDGGWSRLVAGIQAALAGASDLTGVVPRFLDAIELLELEDVAQLADATLTADLIARLHVASADEPIEDVPKVPPRDAVDWWVSTKKVVTAREFAKLADQHKTRAFSVAGYHSLSALADINDAFIATVEEGGTVADFEDRLATLGKSLGSPRHLDTVWRNNTATAYAVGRHVQLVSAQARRPFWQYRTIGDSRVRVAHELMAGRVWPADHEIWSTWFPPNGHGCRCWVVALDRDGLATKGLEVETELPRDAAANRPLLPDKGWAINPAVEPFALDWSRFPTEWISALAAQGVEVDS